MRTATGPTLDGVANGGPGNPLYAGGQGGISGCFPSLSPCTPVLTEIGGLGGAGGTSARLGEAWSCLVLGLAS